MNETELHIEETYRGPLLYRIDCLFFLEMGGVSVLKKKINIKTIND
tara:strand:- start:892 stop:1029 length:138 start_codon:yes stop_codon:yes gene_type:complete